MSDPYSFLESLIQAGRSEAIVTIDGTQIILSNLSVMDEYEIDKKDSSLEFRKHVLAMAIKGINTIRFGYDTCEDENEYKKSRSETIKKIRNLMDNWQSGIINFLFLRFNQLAIESEQKLAELTKIKGDEDGK